MRIKNLLLDNNVFLAPLAGATDKSYRSIVKSFGCSLMFTEMVSAKAVTYDYSKTHKIIEFPDEQRPIGVQLFGHEPEIMAQAARIVEERYKPDILDINMGCPVPKVVKNNEGSALMKDMDLSFQIVKTVTNAVQTPVTVKIRKGFDEHSINAVEFAQAMEQAGANMVTVHGRTRVQYYKGSADWDIIKDVKNALKIPVAGNGDVFSEEDAENMLNHTKCDAIMVARGILGDPFLIKRINHYLEFGEKMSPPTIDEIFSIMYKHLDNIILDKGEYSAVREMRRHFLWYMKGMPNVSKTKKLILEQTQKEQIVKILKQYHNSLKNSYFHCNDNIF